MGCPRRAGWPRGAETAKGTGFTRRPDAPSLTCLGAEPLQHTHTDCATDPQTYVFPENTARKIFRTPHRQVSRVGKEGNPTQTTKHVLWRHTNSPSSAWVEPSTAKSASASRPARCPTAALALSVRRGRVRAGCLRLSCARAHSFAGDGQTLAARPIHTPWVHG